MTCAARHGWRKLAPDTRHPEGDAQAREDRKKTRWHAGPSCSRLRPVPTAAADVPRRGALRAHQRLPSLLVPPTAAPDGQENAVAPVHLCLRCGQPTRRRARPREKTRLLEFGRYAIERRQCNGRGKPQTFKFLGFTFICCRSRRGAFLPRRHTRRDRMRAALREIKDELRQRRHASLADQGRWLRSVVSGSFAYHAVPTNAQAIGAYRHHVIDLWPRSLKRRSQKDRMTWARMDRLAAERLSPPHVLHPWPEERLAVRYPR